MIYRVRNGLYSVSHELSGALDTGHCEISRDGKFATSRGASLWPFWDLERGVEIGKCSGVRAARFTRDQQHVLCIKSDGAVLFDLKAAKVSRKLTKAQLRIGAHSPDGRFEVSVLQQRFDFSIERVSALDGDTPLLESSKSWLDDRHMVLPYVIKDKDRVVGLRIWSADPLEIVSDFRIDAN